MGPKKVFGQTVQASSSKGGPGASRYQRQFGKGGDRGGGGTASSSWSPGGGGGGDDGSAAQAAAAARIRGEALDESFDIERFSWSTASHSHGHRHGHGDSSSSSLTRRGWLYNVLPTTVTSSAEEGDIGGERSGLDLYFLEESGRKFKSTILYRPYFYVLPELRESSSASGTTTTTTEEASIALELLLSNLARAIESAYHVEVVHKIDLDQPNHLSPKYRDGRPVIKIVFDNVRQLAAAREQVAEIIRRRGTRERVFSMDHDVHGEDPLERLQDVREYDVPYVVRVCIDENIRVGTWYTVELVEEARDDRGIRLLEPDIELKADPVILAFDIECTKAPLKFPNAEHDEIFMISYMVSGTNGGPPQGYLIVSKSVVSSDVSDFEYTPKPAYPGPFTIFNEPNEESLLNRFFDEYHRHGPQIVVTYNGDFFDWPFVEARAKVYGMDMYQRVGVRKEGGENGDYRGRCSVHLDAFHWVQRDSYLPQGSQGLKAVTKYKLGYDPVEVDPEDMVRLAQEKPVHMATYSVSDAVATFYLYEKYVHLFIFSLCTIIPMGPEDVLRKGSGTLCETLLMVQACTKSIICPNKQVDDVAKFHQGHLIESETYIGGKVECLETGVYRSDLCYDFDLKPSAFEGLIRNIDRDLTFSIEVEGGLDRKDITNYDEIKSEIIEALELLRDRPKRSEKPYVYHLDVGAMYPNIILSNRLQPSAIVDDAMCASCDYNSAKSNCKRHMEWIWRGDYSPATRNEYERIKEQLGREVHRDGLMFHQLPEKDQAEKIANRLKEYSRMAYKKGKITEEVSRTDVVCMRENPFYVDTVREFRDRRYEYKKLDKQWKKKAAAAEDAAVKKQCEDKVLVYDSLQVAHKCILNSFYGYVMRKGARWRSMEMAGIVTRNGAQIILQAQQLVSKVGRPLELDTDGIWCILPQSFPDVYTFEAVDGSKIKLEYPCVMLNAACHDMFTNHQYQTLVDEERGVYSTRSECSIFFEVDGPYRCMFLPASTEEGKLLKKRYAVFNHDKTLAELKGFELKRRGELELIKTFQSQVFSRFLDGQTLRECYESAAEIANHWIDVIDTRGERLADEELVDLISENRSMSRQLEDYGDQKGTSQTTAQRLGEFLGSEIIKDKGLNCKFIIAEQPYGSPVTERAIPTAIWKAEPAVMKHFLRKWLKNPGLDGDSLDIRNVLDWDYYMDRLSKTIQKIITIPAALQKVPNPVPRVPHPAWLASKVKQLSDRLKQRSINSMFPTRVSGKDANAFASARRKEVDVDIEDFGRAALQVKAPVVHKLKTNVGVVSTSRRLPSSDEKESSNEDRVQLSKESFPAWLQQKKAKWRSQRKDRRKAEPRTADGVLDKRARKNISVESFVREAALTQARREWHVVEIRPATVFDSLGQTPRSSTSGEMIVFVMVGKDTMQRINLTIPRVVYVAAQAELKNECESITHFRKVEKHLPHNKSAKFLYEVVMPEYVFREQKWIQGLKSIDGSVGARLGLETMFESETPLIARAMSSIGAISRLSSGLSAKLKRNFSLDELERVEIPTEGEYLHSFMSYRRLFLYVRINKSSKSGIVALFFLNGSKVAKTGATAGDDSTVDVTRPSLGGSKSFDVGAACHVWVVKPGSKTGQRNVSLKQCDTMFTQLLDAIQEAATLDTEYACVSQASDVRVTSLSFVETENIAFAGANEAIGSSQKGSGPTFLLLTSSKSVSQLRRHMTTFASFPVVSIPFPPGPAHNPWNSSLPALNWEQTAIQLSFEAYLFTVVIAFPKRVAYSRYGHIPVGNLGDDENSVLYESALFRLLQKNRVVSWSSASNGQPDLGVKFLSGPCGGSFPKVHDSSYLCSQDEIWGDDDDLVSPVLRKPGCYRNVCIDIDVQDLAIAALTDYSSLPTSNAHVADPSSPNSVAFIDGSTSVQKHSGPLGDEMSTSTSLPILRALVVGWLRDAFTSGSLVADELLHHVYRLVSSTECLLYDTALHRIVHELMKSTFFRLLGELQRLGCSIVFASFHRITVATNKLHLHQAQEYIDFVISTVRKRAAAMSGGAGEDALSRVSLQPRQFHSHFVFLDEFNFGTIHLTQIRKEEVKEDDEFVLPVEDDPDSAVVPSVVTAWGLMNYLGNSVAQEYFRAIIGRFSSDVFRKQIMLAEDGVELSSVSNQLLEFKKALVKKSFASYLTRALDEIVNDGADAIPPPLLLDATASRSISPIEFVKSVSVVLELDLDVEDDAHALKRSLLAQLGVAEYARVAQWTNPCPSYILPDVFCVECHDSRDVNLCYIPPREADEDYERTLVCEDCGTPIDAITVEKRLISLLHRKLARYQLQDVRCVRSNRVITRALNPSAETTSGMKLDISASDALRDVRLLGSLAEFYSLEQLRGTTEGILCSFKFQ